MESQLTSREHIVLCHALHFQIQQVESLETTDALIARLRRERRELQDECDGLEAENAELEKRVASLERTVDYQDDELLGHEQLAEDAATIAVRVQQLIAAVPGARQFWEQARFYEMMSAVDSRSANSLT